MSIVEGPFVGFSGEGILGAGGTATAHLDYRRAERNRCTFPMRPRRKSWRSWWLGRFEQFV